MILVSPRAQKAVAMVIGVGAATCLIATTMMTRQSAIAQAANEDAQQWLGFSSIAIHLMGVMFAVAAGVSSANKRHWATAGCWFLVVACSALSVSNILDFVASERLTIASAREQQAKVIADREKAGLDAEKHRLDAQIGLAKEAAKWAQGTIKQAEGRREKEAAYGGVTKIIEAVGNAKVGDKTAPPPDQIIIKRPDGGAELLSQASGLSIVNVQLIKSLYFTFVITLVEMVGWNVAVFLWMTATIVPPVALAAAATMAMAHPSPFPPPLPLEPATPQKALPPPSRIATDAKTVTVRANPSAEWRELLDRVDFPPAGSRHKGPLRPKHDADTAALRLLCWLGGYREAGEFHTNTVDALYEEFATADHREPTGTRVIKNALEAMRGRIASKRQVPGHGTMWTLNPPPLDKMVALLEKGGVIKPNAPPPAAAPSAEAPEAQARKPIFAASPFAWGKRVVADETRH